MVQMSYVRIGIINLMSTPVRSAARPARNMAAQTGTASPPGSQRLRERFPGGEEIVRHRKNCLQRGGMIGSHHPRKVTMRIAAGLVDHEHPLRAEKGEQPPELLGINAGIGSYLCRRARRVA